MQAGYFLDQFLITCFAAAFALVPTVMFSHHSSNDRFGALILESLQTTSELLPLSLSMVLDVDLAGKLAALEAKRIGSQERLSTSLKGSVHQLRPVLNNYRLEFRRSRVASASFEVLVNKIRRLHRNPLLGPTSHIPGERIQSALQRAYGNHSGSATPRTPRDSSKGRSRSRGPRDTFEMARGETPTPSPVVLRRGHSFIYETSGHYRSRSVISLPTSKHAITYASRNLVKAIQQALQSSSTELISLCDWPASSSAMDKVVGAVQAKDELEVALSELQLNLALLLNGLGTDSYHTKHTMDSMRQLVHADMGDKNHFRLAFYMTALLDLAKEVLEFLNVVISISKTARPSKRVYFPILPGMSRLGAQAGSPSTAQIPGHEDCESGA